LNCVVATIRCAWVFNREKMSMRAIVLMPALLLAACNSSPTITATNATGAEVAQKVEAAGDAGINLTPGRWEGTATISDVTMPGAPAALAEKMKVEMSGGEPFATCLTPEEAKRPRERFFSGRGEGGCLYKNFTMGGGKIDAVMECPAGASVTLNGTYAAGRYTMAVDTRAKGMSMKMTMDSKHVGPCKGDEG
jgi:hypothetical protein